MAESRYAPVEGEALAVAYALDHARYFVLGCEDLIIAVDHKPLLSIIWRQVNRHSEQQIAEFKGKDTPLSFQDGLHSGC